jgi:hypothetical protein
MHKYVDTSDFRAPFDSPQLDMAGLGSEYPTARSYFDISNFRAPYDERGYFQKNDLFGVGAATIPEAISQIQQSVCPVKDPIRNPYTVTAALLGAVVGVGLGFVIGRVLR